MTTPFTPPSRLPVSDALISIVLPIYNESGVLVELCKRLRSALIACNTTFEIIFVNDGSRDGSPLLLDRLAAQYSEVRVVHLSRNFGHQAASHAGLAHARGDAVVLMDADLQDPPEAIGELLEAWQAGYDVVYAVRKSRKEAIWKRALFAGFHRLLSLFSRSPIPVDAGNFGLIDARVLHSLMTLGERDLYLPGLRSWVGFKQIGIPIQRGRRYDDRPRVSLRGLWRLAKTAIFSFSSLPLSIFAWLGTTALTAFVGMGAYALACHWFTDAGAPAWISTGLQISFFAALNALGISVLGEYQIRIYDQVRARPLYLVDRTANFAADAEQNFDPSAIPASADTLAEQSASIDLDRLDPLELDTQWDDAYQHLLDQAQDLADLGALARSEADDLADRRSLGSDDTQLEVDSQPAAAAPGEALEEEPRLLKLTGATPRR